MQERGPDYLPLTQGRDDKAKERAIEYFTDKDRREAFFKFFRQLQNLYDIISPDAFLRPFLEDYEKLAELYSLIRNAYAKRIYVDRELTAKTKELLRKHAQSGDLELPGAIYELGPKELAALKNSDASDTVKILNLRKILDEIVVKEGAVKPFLLSIGERAEALAQAYEDRQLTTQQALTELEALAQEYVEADADRQAMGVDDNTFAIYHVLKTQFQGVSKEQAMTINAVFADFPDYKWDEAQMRKLRTQLYKVLYPLVGSDQVIEAVNKILRLQRV